MSSEITERNRLPTDDVSGMLGMVTVYDHPKDYPEHYVARQFWSGRNIILRDGIISISTSLEEVRRVLANCGLVKLDRNKEDDPAIVETWL